MKTILPRYILINLSLKMGFGNRGSLTFRRGRDMLGTSNAKACRSTGSDYGYSDATV